MSSMPIHTSLYFPPVYKDFTMMLHTCILVVTEEGGHTALILLPLESCESTTCRRYSHTALVTDLS